MDLSTEGSNASANCSERLVGHLETRSKKVKSARVGGFVIRPEAEEGSSQNPPKNPKDIQVNRVIHP